MQQIFVPTVCDEIEKERKDQSVGKFHIIIENYSLICVKFTAAGAECRLMGVIVNTEPEGS